MAAYLRLFFCDIPWQHSGDVAIRELALHLQHLASHWVLRGEKVVRGRKQHTDRTMQPNNDGTTTTTTKGAHIKTNLIYFSKMPRFTSSWDWKMKWHCRSVLSSIMHGCPSSEERTALQTHQMHQTLFISCWRSAEQCGLSQSSYISLTHGGGHIEKRSVWASNYVLTLPWRFWNDVSFLMKCMKCNLFSAEVGRWATLFHSGP